MIENNIKTQATVIFSNNLKTTVISNTVFESLLKSLDEIFKPIINKNSEYIPNEKDCLYFLPGCTVPRFKISKFIKKYNNKMVKFRDKANTLFISNKIQKNIFEPYSNNFSYIKKTLILKYISSEEKQNEIMNSSSEYVKIGPQYHLPRNLKIEDDICSYQFKDHNMVDLFKNIYLNSCIIYNESLIFKYLNDYNVLSEQQYHSIKLLFESEDVKDTNLAMETLANCDFEKNCVFIVLLLAEYKTKINKSNVKNHVNFKTLLNYFQLDLNSRIDIDVITECLINKNLLNDFTFNQLTPLAHDAINNKYSSDYFKIGNLIPSENLIDILDKNITIEDNTIIFDDSEDEELKLII